MVPSCPMAGELKMMSPVAYAHLSDPSRPTAYSLLSCDPTRTAPSAASAGDDTIGPPVANVHQTAGLVGGSRNGERPRWVGPKRNIACAGSSAYWGSGTCGPVSPCAITDGRVASPGQTHRPASHRRLSLQSLSAAHGVGSTWAQPNPARAALDRSRAATSVTRRTACLGQVTGNRERAARERRGPGETHPATDMEFGWRKVKANWKSCKIV